MRSATAALLFTLSVTIYSYALAATNSPAFYTEANTAIGVTADNPVFTLKLKSNPTTGFAWFLRDYNAALVASVSHHFEAPTNKKLMGAPGYEVWSFKMKPVAFSVPQQTTIKLIYARPWDTSESSAPIIFKITTLAK